MSRKIGTRKEKIHKFDLDSLYNDSTILVLGRRRSGKSWLIRDLMYHKRFMKQVLVFSGTEHVSPFMGDFIPDIFIHSDFSSELVENVLVNQSIKIKKAKKNHESEDGKTDGNNMAIIMDDMLHDAKTWTKDRSVKELFYNGRHYNLMYVVALQYVHGLPPEFRDNLDYVFIYPQENPNAKHKVFESFGSCIDTYREFCDILEQCTENYCCLVVKLSGSGSNKICDKIFWYKAERPSNFKVGSNKYWNYHKSNYNEKYVDKKQTGKKLQVYVNKEGNIVDYNKI
jgi:hypothetical protein